jgi:anti-anti-sigma regulatory factor
MARTKKRSETRRISLGDDLRIARAREVLQIFVDARGAGQVEIDAAAVERIDAAGLQALAAGIASLREAKVERRWGTVSPALAAAAALAGFEGPLELS